MSRSVGLNVRLKLQRACLYKDNHLLALNKWAGLVCQGVRPGARTIGERVLKVFGASTDVEALEVPQPLHRLDKPTTGVLLMARSKLAARHVSQLFAEHKVGKEYLAVCAGLPKIHSGVIIGRRSKANKRSGARQVVAPNGIVVHPLPDGVEAHDSPTAAGDGGGEGAEDTTATAAAAATTRMAAHKRGAGGSSSSAPAAVAEGESRTRFQVVGSCGPYVSLIRLFPETGHKHQVRLHCADGLGTPVLGDTVYGKHANDGGVTRWVRDMLRENLEMPKNEPVSVPLLLHARATTLPGLGKDGADLVIEAPVPTEWRTICSGIGLIGLLYSNFPGNAIV
eukprot:gene19466-12715_t